MKLKQRLLGHLAYCLTWLLKKSLRVKVEVHPGYNSHQHYLFAFWHGKQLLPILVAPSYNLTQYAVLISPSRDGDILATWLKLTGFEVLRGSSRRDNVSALAGMIRKLKQGYSVGFGIDGPLGPIHKVKPGMTHMAKKLNIQILPLGSAFDRKWVFEKAWDKFEIPKPFSKAVIYAGEPITIGEDADLELSNLNLEQAIKNAEMRAHALL